VGLSSLQPFISVLEPKLHTPTLTFPDVHSYSPLVCLFYLSAWVTIPC
jgi:hypothetical protein